MPAIGQHLSLPASSFLASFGQSQTQPTVKILFRYTNWSNPEGLKFYILRANMTLKHNKSLSNLSVILVCVVTGRIGNLSLLL